jgi:hypothetical protein
VEEDPGDRTNCPAEAAHPNATVATSFGTSAMVSAIASIIGTDPPGELIHRWMSSCGSSSLRRVRRAMMSIPEESSNSPLKTTTRRGRSMPR